VFFEQEVSLANGAARFAFFVAVLLGVLAVAVALLARHFCLCRWALKKRASGVPFLVGAFLPLYGFLFGWSLFTTTLSRISPEHVALAVGAGFIAFGAAGLSGAIIDWARTGNRLRAVPAWSLSTSIVKIGVWIGISLSFGLILDSNRWWRW
jgi:hypothetical protein